MGSFGRILRPVFDPGLAVAPPWWSVDGKTCMAAYRAKGAASLAASYVNLVNSGTYDAAPGVAPTFDSATGWAFNGAEFLETGITLQTNYTVLVRFSDAADSESSCIMGGRTGAYDYGLFPSVSSVVHRFVSRITYVQAVPAVASGIMGTAAAGCYLNGANEGTLDGMGPALIRIGAFLAYSGLFTGKIQAIVVYSDTLTAGEVATVSAAMAAL